VHPLGLHSRLPGHSLLPTKELQAVGVLLLLKAFSAGCSALTGVEAIANGVPLFKPPRAVRAKRTEVLLGCILGLMLLGLAVLARRWHIGPRSDQTVLSQIMSLAVGRHWAYYLISLTITLVLGLAANTSFGGLPVLCSLLGRDNYLPHLFSLRDDRQVFATGIWALTIMSGLLLVAVDGDTNRLIPLYAIGVFTGFTLSQTGLVVHWWRDRPPHWWYRATVNMVGAATTAVATVIFLISKFTTGAWVVVVAVPLFILLFTRVHAYYAAATGALGMGKIPPKPQGRPTLVVVPLAGISKSAQRALSEALSISEHVIAVRVVVEQGEDEEAAPETDRQMQDEWGRWAPGVPLQVLHTEYASVVRPVVDFVDALIKEHPDEQLIVLVPVVVPDRLRYLFLHNHIDAVLTKALRGRPDIVVAKVPTQLSTRPRRARAPAGA